MPPPVRPSTAVRIAFGLVTGLLLIALAFGAVALCSMGVGVVRHGDSLLYGDTLHVPMQLSTEGLAPLPPPLTAPSWVAVDVEIEDPTTEQMFLRSAADLGPLVLVVLALWLVRRVLQSVVRGDPFGARNVRRLRDLGVLLAAGGVVVALLGYLLRQAMYDQLPPVPSVDLGVAGFELPGGLLLGGLAAFVLAAVFAHGAQLREDVEGTI